MKYLIVSLIVVVGVITLTPKAAQPQVQAEVPMCAKGTIEEQDNCTLDPSDCGRGIDEANQESCGN